MEERGVEGGRNWNSILGCGCPWRMVCVSCVARKRGVESRLLTWRARGPWSHPAIAAQTQAHSARIPR